jgi:hypothetical protein
VKLEGLGVELRIVATGNSHPAALRVLRRVEVACNVVVACTAVVSGGVAGPELDGPVVAQLRTSPIRSCDSIPSLIAPVFQ